MSPGWISAALAGAGIVALAYAAPRARAAEPEKRQWAIERCHDGRCEVMGWRYSGPTSCNLDAASARIGRQMPSGVRLVCVRKGER